MNQVLDASRLYDMDVEQAVKEIYDGYTVLDGNGNVMACIGVTEMDSHNAMAWALMAENIGLRMFSIHKKVQDWLNGCGYDNVYADVREEFSRGHMWVAMLGFIPFGITENFYDDGANAILYRRDRL